MKWYGRIGFFVEEQDEPGVIVNKIITRRYFGDIIKNYKRDDSNSMINTNFKVNNRISVVCDPFALNNFHRIAYITFMGTKWRVNTVEVQYPRLILDLSELYNEEYEEGGDECGAN